MLIHQPITRETAQQQADRLLQEERAVRRAAPLYAQIQQLRRDVSDSEVDRKARTAAENKAADLREKAAAIAADACLSENELEKLCAADLRSRARQAPRPAFNQPPIGKGIGSASREAGFVRQELNRITGEIADFNKQKAALNEAIAHARGAASDKLLTRVMDLNRKLSTLRVRKEKKYARLRELDRIVNGEAA